MEVFPDVGVSMPNTLALQSKKQTRSSPRGFSREQQSQYPAQTTCSETLPWVPRAQSGEQHKTVAKSSYPSFSSFCFSPSQYTNCLIICIKLELFLLRLQKNDLIPVIQKKYLLILYIIRNYSLTQGQNRLPALQSTKSFTMQ